MMWRVTRTRLAAVALALPLALTLASPADAATDAPPPTHTQVDTALPPGESGFFPPADEAQYMADGNPADFGPHVDDQRDLYWSSRTKPGGFADVATLGAPQTPLAGVRVYRDPAGVPVIYGDTGRAVWAGAGYAAATDRLFELDAVRRLAEGRFGELAGATRVPADLEARTVGYTSAEYDQMLARLSPQGRDAIEGYAAGVEARITEVRADPMQLPAEYVLLSSLPADWTVEDTLAAGVYITRDVASEGGGEMQNVAQLRELEQQYGKTLGRKVFEDLFTEEDPSAVTSVPGTTFSNVPAGDSDAAHREAAFQAMADAADALPDGLATGPGTGDSAVPPGSVSAPKAQTAQQAAVAHAVASVGAWGKALHGGSFAYAVAGSRTADGHALLSSNPQLDYSYPGLLWELEVHGGGYDARGVSVPGIPTVGIGSNAHVAWGLTTGYSKTIDSYIETTRANPTAGAPEQYLHDGQWVDESCRTETIPYRASAAGAPVGPASLSESAQVCRTVHGPVVATSTDGTRARSEDYAMWLHEDDTVEGILDWDRATSLADVQAGVAKVTWNENIVATDDQGNIGYWHPGLYRARAVGVDQRLPTPGTGAYDPTGYLPFAAMPHSVDPAQGYLVSWNTKPAHGWLDGDDEEGDQVGGSTTRPGGPANRVTRIIDQISTRTDLRGADLQPIETAVGESDMRATAFRPLLVALRASSGLTAQEQQVLDLLLAWDGRAYDPGGASSPLSTPAPKVTDGSAATAFGALAPALQAQLLSGLPADVRARMSARPKEGHQYDLTPADQVVLRVLRPGFSGVTPALGYAGGRSADAVVKAALDSAIGSLTSTYGSADPSTWHRAHAVSHVTSFTDTVGPTGVTQPFQDRGSWVQHVAFTTGTAYAPLPAGAPVVAAPVVAAPPLRSSTHRTVTKRRRPTSAAARPTAPTRSLAATGGDPLLAAVAAGLVGVGLAVRRRRRR